MILTVLKSLLTPSNKMDIWTKYTRKHKLGTGMCGPVYVIQDKRSGQEFAGKSVRKNSLNSRLQTDMLREIAILKQARMIDIFSVLLFFDYTFASVTHTRTHSHIRFAAGSSKCD